MSSIILCISKATQHLSVESDGSVCMLCFSLLLYKYRITVLFHKAEQQLCESCKIEAIWQCFYCCTVLSIYSAIKHAFYC